MLSHQIYTPTYCDNTYNQVRVRPNRAGERSYSNRQSIFTGRTVQGVHQFTYETPSVVSSGILQFTYETPNVVSSGIPQFTYETPNVVSSGILQTERVGVLECPTSPQNKVKQEIHTLETTEHTTSIPIVQYTSQDANEIFDPSIVNTPPSEFMNQLKSRLDVYYSASS